MILKRFTALCFALITVTTVAMAQAEITFENKVHDFGEIKEDGGRVTHEFSFKNSGDAPLFITSATASCGCTKPKYEKKPLAPGEKSTLSVTYNPMNRPGNFSKAIYVKSNASSQNIRLSIKGKTTPRVKTEKELYPRAWGELNAKSTHVGFGKAIKKPGSIYTKEIAFKNLSEEVIKLSIPATPDFIKVSTTLSTVKPGEEGILTVELDANSSKQYGFASTPVQLTTEGSSKKSTTINISYNLAEDFSGLTPEDRKNSPVVGFKEKMVNIGTVKINESLSHKFTITNSGKKALIIRSTRASSNLITIVDSPKEIAPGEKGEISIIFKSPKVTGRHNKSISVITNDPNRPISVLRLIGTVEK